MEIRYAQVDDANWLETVAKETGLSWKATDFVADMVMNHAIYLVHSAGFISCHHVCGEAEITNVAILQKEQGKGYAKKLWESLLEEFKVHNVVTCFLEVRLSNEKARGFYEKIGFVQVGERKKYYHNPTEDAVIYRWEKDE